MGKGFRLRDATDRDRPFLLEMLVEAADWKGDGQFDRETVLARPELSRYIADWPADGEIGQVAGVEDHAIGACWLRFFTAERPGYGYVADDVPELSVAVSWAWRGQGVGRLLLRKIADRAKKAGINRICLSVERANRAHSLYESEGYKVVERGVDADTMMIVL